ncbi:xanthine dehydrogenase family protein molybdopterin-binding subunit [Litoreibacter roseus]|nr:molybdopterin cofactor-binding domain-containing protein [Litoreibacter roseus]
MSRVGKITRRTLLVASAAVAGGVAFGVYQARRELPNPLRPAEGQTSLNPYLIIDQSGVTIITPRAEMGQGIHTTLAAMVAEELDVAWDSVKVMHGPGDQAYFNGAIMGLAMPFRDYAETDFQTRLKVSSAVMAKMMGLQVTGGSTSTIDGYEKMRMAGATARETLKMAAANQLGAGVDTLETRAGHVIAADGTMLSYADLAPEAALLDTPRSLELRDPSTWRYLGQSMPRKDQSAKATGTAEFGADVRLPGMKFAAIRINPNLGAPVESYDDTDARKMAGVEEIIPFDNGVAVVATNTWLAMKATDAVQITWAPAPYPPSTKELLTVIEAGFESKPNSTLRDDGDVETVLAEATEKVTAAYSVPWLAHATMEPMNATALYTGDALTIWSGNQAPLITRDKCAEAVGLDKDAVEVITPFLGGGFGRRGEFDFSRYAALVAKAVPGTPIKVTWSREEDMRHDFYRPAALARFEGVVEEGQIKALSGAVSAPSVTRQSSLRLAGFAPPGPDKGHVEGAFDQPYGIPNFRYQGHFADLEVPIGFWRSVGNSYNAFFMESFIDEMAHAAARDPLEFRKELAAREHEPSAMLLQKVKEMSDWTGQTGPDTGRGVALTYSFGTPVAEIIEVRDEDGAIRVTNAWIACDVGRALDPEIIRAQMSSGLIYGLSAAIWGEITFENGQVVQENFPDYDAMRINTCPEIAVEIRETNTHMGGVGEPGLPPAAPALANAVFDLTGTRPRELPLSKNFSFVS